MAATVQAPLGASTFAWELRRSKGPLSTCSTSTSTSELETVLTVHEETRLFQQKKPQRHLRSRSPTLSPAPSSEAEDFGEASDDSERSQQDSELQAECRRLEEACRALNAELSNRKLASARLAAEFGANVEHLRKAVAESKVAEEAALCERSVLRAEAERLREEGAELERQVAHLRSEAPAAAAEVPKPHARLDVTNDAATKAQLKNMLSREGAAQCAEVETPGSSEPMTENDLRSAIEDLQQQLADGARRIEESRRRAELYERLASLRSERIEEAIEEASDAGSKRLLADAELAVARQAARLGRERADRCARALAAAERRERLARAARRAMAFAPVAAAWLVSARWLWMPVAAAADDSF